MRSWESVRPPKGESARRAQRAGAGPEEQDWGRELGALGRDLGQGTGKDSPEAGHGKGPEHGGTGAVRAQDFVNHARGMMEPVHAILGIPAPAKGGTRPQGARAGGWGMRAGSEAFRASGGGTEFRHAGIGPPRSCPSRSLLSDAATTG
jgi:hypothetical protein